MHIPSITFWILILWSHALALCQSYFYIDTLPTFIDNDQISQPFSGGINNGQFNNFDLNFDGNLDVVVFDKGNQKFLPYVFDPLNHKYNYSPTFESYFPNCENFVLMKDYNGDGINDLFTYTTLGIKVFKTIKDKNTFGFELSYNLLYSDYYNQKTNILLNSNDYPIIDDVDGDGDLDIVNFNFATGSSLEYHKNISLEKYGHLDSLCFKQITECFGGFQEISCDSFKTGLNCDLKRSAPSSKRLAHVGAGALLFFDVDNDGLKDLTLSKEECNHLVWFKNVGTKIQPKFDTKNQKFPTNSTPISYAGFPVPFALKVFGENHERILLSRGTPSSGFILNFESSNILLDRQYQVYLDGFLQKQALDLGEYSHPITFDVDGDGDLDILAGYHSYKINDKYTGGIAMFENLRNDKKPIYLLRTKNWGNFGTYEWTFVHPQILDFNQDSFHDLLITASNPRKGLATNVMLFKGNSNSRLEINSIPDTLTLALNIGDIPYFTNSLDPAKITALVGKTNGSLLLFTQENKNWNLTNNALGFPTNSDFISKELTIAEAYIDQDQYIDLIISSSNKRIYYVSDYISHLNEIWTPKEIKSIDFVNDKIIPVLLSSKPTIHVNPLGQIWSGSKSGGFISLTNKPTNLANMEALGIFPNPFDNYIFCTIEDTPPEPIKITDLSGKLLLESKTTTGLNIFQLQHLNTGIYLFTYKSHVFKIVKK